MIFISKVHVHILSTLFCFSKNLMNPLKSRIISWSFPCIVDLYAYNISSWILNDEYLYQSQCYSLGWRERRKQSIKWFLLGSNKSVQFELRNNKMLIWLKMFYWVSSVPAFKVWNSCQFDTKSNRGNTKNCYYGDCDHGNHKGCA